MGIFTGKCLAHTIYVIVRNISQNFYPLELCHKALLQNVADRMPCMASQTPLGACRFPSLELDVD